MSKTYDTPESRARRVLSNFGKAPVLLTSMSQQEVETIGALVNEQGEPVDGAREMFDSLLMEHYKAVDGDKDPPPPDVAAQQKVRDEAAKLVAGEEKPEQIVVRGAPRKAKFTADETKEGE